MICFVRLVGGTNFDALKIYFRKIHSSTNEGIVTWCGSTVQVCSLMRRRNGKYERRISRSVKQKSTDLVEIHKSSSLTIFHWEKAISSLTRFSLKYYEDELSWVMLFHFYNIGFIRNAHYVRLTKTNKTHNKLKRLIKTHNSMMICKLELEERRYGNPSKVDNTHNKLVISP